VTSADVVFTWEVGRHPKTGVSDFESFRRILSIEVLDDKTFTLHVDRIEFTYNALALQILPEHIERPIFEADPAGYRNRTAFDAEPANPGLAFGPYKVVELVSGSHIVLGRNDTWWGAEPAFDKVTVRVIENTAALEANLLSGAIDMIAGELGVTIDQALAFEKRHGARYHVSYKPGLIYEHLDLNLDNPILADRRVRKALILALDREALSQRLFAGRQPVADSSVSPLDWIHDPDSPTYPYDPEAAKALLDEAGWNVVQDGVRHNAAGARLTLELMTTAGNRSRELVEQVLQSMWREVGIEAQAQVHRRGHVRLAVLARKRAAHHAAFRPDSERGQRLGRAELHRVSEPRDGRADRRDRGGARPGQAQGALGAPAAALRRGAAGDSAVLARQRLRPAQMADRRPPHRPPRHHYLVDRGMAR
jgi:peptide/nickel transport system substrate-binding protein